MSCRDELLTIIRDLVDKRNNNEFTLSEIIHVSKEKNIPYSESTIKTHISSRMCKNSPQNHLVKYEDIERLSRGIYKIF